jgi:hypothetical protein
MSNGPTSTHPPTSGYSLRTRPGQDDGTVSGLKVPAGQEHRSRLRGRIAAVIWIAAGDDARRTRLKWE